MPEGTLTRSHDGLSANGPLTVLERYFLIGLAVLLLAFGCLFELRSALMQSRKGDLNVFLRAAWAVRAGEDIYEATDDNDHHYHYPPFLAVLLVPLADPPAGCARPGVLPYAVSVAIWYVLSIVLLAAALDLLATALEATLYAPPARPRPGCRRWWALRIYPLIACLPAIGGALMRGQVDMILLALFCGMMACALRGRSVAAGLLLAAAISIKVIPAFLLLYPLWKRDTRWLVSCAAGLVVFLIVVPTAVFGPRQTMAYYQEWDELVLRPGLTKRGDQTRAEELTNVTGTDSQSFVAVAHNLRYPTRPRPAMASSGERLLHWALGGFLTLTTLALASRARRAGRDGTIESVLFIASLLLLMLLTSPVCHLHYFSMSTPLAMGLLAASWKKRGHSTRLTPGLIALFAFNVVANAVPRIPGMEMTRDLGLATLAGLTLWAWACATLWKAAPPSPLSIPLKAPSLAA
jgi:hypothetical protein